MSTINNNTLLITLSEPNDYVANFDTSQMKIYNTQYFSTYSTYVCSIDVPFSNLCYNYNGDTGELTTNRIIDTLEHVGVYYKVSQRTVDRGEIKLVKKQDHTYPNSISILFTFFTREPTMIQSITPNDREFIHGFLDPLSNNLSINLNTTPIFNHSCFQFFSNYYARFKISFLKPMQCYINDGEITSDIGQYITPNTNRLEYLQNNEITTLQTIYIEIESSDITSKKPVDTIFVYFVFFKQ